MTRRPTSLNGENICSVLAMVLYVQADHVLGHDGIRKNPNYSCLRPYSEGLQCPLKTLEFPKVPFSTASRFNETNHQNQGLIVTFALTSIFAGIFDIKHYFHLQVSVTPGIVL